MPILPAEEHAIVVGSTLMVDLDALTRNVDAHLRPEPEPEECRHTFCTVTNVLSQMTGDEPIVAEPT
jgi:hypothetical protein